MQIVKPWQNISNESAMKLGIQGHILIVDDVLQGSSEKRTFIFEIKKNYNLRIVHYKVIFIKIS